MKTAQILIVGDEILSGRTQDSNSHYIAHALFVRGIRTQRIEVLGDNFTLISQWVNHKHALTDYTFICGGIGGTPDDVTRQAVAHALNVPLIRNSQAEKMLRDFYKERVNEDRLSMADFPQGAQLISNKVTVAPGIKIKNIYVLAGIPEIMKAMFEAIQPELQGNPLFEETLELQVGEGEIATLMRVLNQEFPLLELGSYPTLDKTRGYKTQLVFRSELEKTVENSILRFRKLCEDKNIKI